LFLIIRDIVMSHEMNARP